MPNSFKTRLNFALNNEDFADIESIISDAVIEDFKNGTDYDIEVFVSLFKFSKDDLVICLINKLKELGINEPFFRSVNKRKQNIFHLMADCKYSPAPEMIAFLLKNIPSESINSIDKDGQTPLHILIKQTKFISLPMMKYFFKIGANINAQDRFSKTALHYAIIEGSLNKVDLLLKQGADCNIRDSYGRNALHVVCLQEHECKYKSSVQPQILSLILEKSNYINAQDKSGNTALHYVIQSENIDLFETLMEKNPNLRLRNNEGHNCFDAARFKKKKGIIKYLNPIATKVKAESASKMNRFFLISIISPIAVSAASLYIGLYGLLAPIAPNLINYYTGETSFKENFTNTLFQIANYALVMCIFTLTGINVSLIGLTLTAIATDILIKPSRECKNDFVEMDKFLNSNPSRRVRAKELARDR